MVLANSFPWLGLNLCILCLAFIIDGRALFIFVQLRKNCIAWWSFESSPSFLSIKVCQSFNVRPFYALHFLFQSLLNVVQSIKASTQHDDMSKPNLILTLHSKWWWIFLHCLASLYTLHNQCSSIIRLFVLYLYKRTLGTFVCLESEK